MLSFASICPHPPLIVPTIGSTEDLERVQRTIKAMEKLREDFEKKKIETLIIISPHGPIDFAKMGIITTPNLSGNLSVFGDLTSDFSFKNDTDVCKKIKYYCERERIPLRVHKIGSLDHGMLVPLFYLTKNFKPKVVPMVYSLLDNSTHFLLGKVLGEIAEKEKKKIGFVASGDLSHRLLPGAPAGFSPQAKEFDKKLIELLKEKNIDGILNMDEDLIEQAGECGYKSIIVLLGTLSTVKNWKFEILSYEGPFGVGYLVVNVTGL